MCMALSDSAGFRVLLNNLPISPNTHGDYDEVIRRTLRLIVLMRSHGVDLYRLDGTLRHLVNSRVLI